jgi:hypothetical protein
MLGVSYELRICFRVHVSTFAKRDLKVRDCPEPASQLEHRVRKGDVVTYLIQIVNEPDEVIFPKVLHPSFIPLPVKSVVEPIGELG